jgi:hypothetical protein
MRMLICFFLTIALIASASIANAALLCAKRKTGVVTVRELGCRGNEVQLDPIGLGLKGDKGDPGAKGDKGDSGPQGLPATTPNAIDCQMVTTQPGCPGPTPTGNQICAAQAPGKNCVATYLVIFSSDVRDARPCADAIDACAISGSNSGGARVLCCSISSQ